MFVMNKYIKLLILALLSLLFIASFFTSGAYASTASVDVSFTGPNVAHVRYSYPASTSNMKYRFVIEDPGGSITVFSESASGASGKTFKDQGLNGSYKYIIQTSTLFAGETEWSEWTDHITQSIDIDSNTAASGNLLFDQSLIDATIDTVSVGENYTLTLDGYIKKGNPGSISVSGSIQLNSNVEFENSHSLDSVKINLYSPVSISEITGGVFRPHVSGVSFSNCEGIVVEPWKQSGAEVETFITIDDSEMVGIHFDSSSNSVGEIVISKSSVIAFNSSIARGKISLNNVVWEGHPENAWITLLGESKVFANESDFKVGVEVGHSNLSESSSLSDVEFRAFNSTFSGFVASRVAAGNVEMDLCVFKKGISITGGFPFFDRCVFRERVHLQNSTGANFLRSDFLDSVDLGNLSGSNFAEDVLPWHHEDHLTPVIINNAFLGEVAFRHNFSPDQEPSEKIQIGKNYYGGPPTPYYGWSSMDAKFLHGYGAWYDGSIFTLADEHDTSPTPGSKMNNVFPKFWVQNYIYGQNTLHHYHEHLVNPNIKGRETLLSVDLATTHSNLNGVKVYAMWDGKKVYAEPRYLPLHRDLRSYSPHAIHAARSTVNIILPPVDEDTMTASVYVDASGIRGSYDIDDYPETDQFLFQQQIAFNDPPERPLRLLVLPVHVRGNIIDYGTGKTGGVVRTLSRDLPGMLPIPEDKVNIEIGMVAISEKDWLSSLTSLRVLNRIATYGAIARYAMEKLDPDTAPDFVVMVLPQRFVTGYFQGWDYLDTSFEGANLALRRRIIIVSDGQPSASLHELGHAIGMYNSQEQYNMHPPSGLFLEQETKFDTISPNSRGIIGHFPNRVNPPFWYDAASYNYDIMGSASSPIWPISNTNLHFHQWFQSNLKSSQVSSLALNSVQTLDYDNYRRIFVSGAVSSGLFCKDSIVSFDVSDLETEPLSPYDSGWFSHKYNLIAYNAESEEIHSSDFFLHNQDIFFEATFDIPASADSFVIKRVQSGKIVYHEQQAGLLSNEITSPITGDAIGPLFEAEWSVQADNDNGESLIMHSLYYRLSPDGPWTPIAVTDETEFSSSSSFLADSDYLELKLLSSDGIKSVKHVVQGLSVSQRQPQVSIIEPKPGDSGQRKIPLDNITDQFGGNGVDREFQLASAITEKPVVEVARDFGEYQQKSVGIFDQDTDKDFYYNPGSDLIYQDESKPVLESSDLLRVSYNINEILVWSLRADVTDYSGQGLGQGKWISNLDGELGFGADLDTELSVGTHILTYEVASDNGLSGSDSVTVHVYESMDTLDLSITDEDLTLHNRSIDPAGYSPTFLLKNENNYIRVRLRNQGINASALIQLFVRSDSSGTETFVGEKYMDFEPFELQHIVFDFVPNQKDVYTFRAVVDQVEPGDPNPVNNEAELECYIPVLINLVANPEEGGSVPGEGIGAFKLNEEVTAEAIPAEGYTFVNWTEDGVEVSSNTEYTFAAAGDRELVANFDDGRVKITADPDPEDAGLINDGFEYSERFLPGETVTLIASAWPGYAFLKWTENGEEVSTDAEYVFAAATDRNLAAIFVEVPDKVTLISPDSWETVSGASIDFEWNAVSDATRYNIKIVRIEGDFSHSPFKDIELGAVTSVKIEEFPEDGTNYGWKVRAGNADAWGEWSAMRSFYSGTYNGDPDCIVSKPDQPEGPVNGVINVPYTYTTGGSECSCGGVVEYQFWWYPDDFSQWYYTDWSTSTSAEITFTEPGTYIIDVNAVCAEGGAWSEISEVLSVVVTGEEDVYDYSISLGEGWNLLSVPRWAKVVYIDGDKVGALLTYTGEVWENGSAEDLKNPALAIFVKMKEQADVQFMWEEINPENEFAEQELTEGWNLISSGLQADYLTILAGLHDEGDGGLTQIFAPNSYNSNKQEGYHLLWESPLVGLLHPGEDIQADMFPFDGYWVFLRGEALEFSTPVGSESY